MQNQKLTPAIINAAIEGFESQKRRIDVQIAELRNLLPGARVEPDTDQTRPKRRKMSAAARARIAAAQRKRWAASRKQAKASAKSAGPARKRKLSAAGRRAIAEASKKRWAAVRARKRRRQIEAARTGIE